MTRSGRLHTTLHGHTDTVMVVRFDPGKPDSRIFSSGYDGLVKYWDFQKGECLKTFVGHSSVVFDLCVDDYIIVSVGRK
jgi:WD40 repeat protein